MDSNFQLGLLSYLVQSSNGEKYIENINEDIFDVLEFKLAIQLLKRYYKLFNKIPGNLAAKDFLEDEIARTPDMSKKIAKDLRETFTDIYYFLDKKDSQYIEDQLILNLQEKEIDIHTSKYAKGEITAEKLFEKLGAVSSLVLPGEEDIYKASGFLSADRLKHDDEQIYGAPTFLHDLNRLTAAGGFYSPQLIVFMSGPKHFKTGLLISIAMEYARSGYKVYYADTENGVRSIRNRMKMRLMECELHEIYDPEIYEDLQWNLEMFGSYMGGDIFIDSFPANTKSIKDASNRLDYLKEKNGFVPEVIIWDDISHFKPSNPADQNRDIRIKSQIVYHEAIALNYKLNTFAIAPSQVNRGGISKKTLKMTDIAEDFGKVMNAHAIFAICATDEEMEDGVRRIIPIAQREGKSYSGKNQCIIRVDEKRMMVDEAEAIYDNLEDN